MTNSGLGEWLRRILGPVHDNEKENWRLLTDKRNL
jgi:hypothetical protein